MDSSAGSTVPRPLLTSLAAGVLSCMSRRTVGSAVSLVCNVQSFVSANHHRLTRCKSSVMLQQLLSGSHRRVAAPTSARNDFPDALWTCSNQTLAVRSMVGSGPSSVGTSDAAALAPLATGIKASRREGPFWASFRDVIERTLKVRRGRCMPARPKEVYLSGLLVRLKQLDDRAHQPSPRTNLPRGRLK